MTRNCALILSDAPADFSRFVNWSWPQKIICGVLCRQSPSAIARVRSWRRGNDEAT